MSFGADLQGFARKTGIKFDTVLRKVVIDITSDIVKMTPVDTGHARSNYFWGNSRATNTDPTLSKNGAPSISRALEFAGAVRAGGVCYITNNLPYIMKLEFGTYNGPTEKVTAAGFSSQAPHGMARVTVAKWQGIVNAAVRAL